MGLRKPTRELRHDPKHVAFSLEPACDMSRLAQQIDDADGLVVMQLISRLLGNADGVKARRIVRMRAE